MSRPGTSAFIRRTLKSVLPLFVVVFVAAACSSDGFPQSFTDQVDPETGLSNVQQNFLEGCEVALASSDLAPDANRVCECSYRSLSSPVADGGIAFEDFVQLNDDLQGDPNRLSQPESDSERRLVEIVSGCIASG